jgi:hypothetical protein
MPRAIRRWPVAGAVVVVIAAGVWFAFDRSPRHGASASAPVGAPRSERGVEATSGAAAGSEPRSRRELPPPASQEVAPGDLAAGDLVAEPDSDEIAAAWATVDMDEVRAAMPDNLYWQLGMPTGDEKVQEARAAERARWNVEYGKVISGTASEEEIHAYYDQRARLSGDYVEFTSYVLDHYRDQLPERDVGLLELGRRLHLARLEEIPRQVEEALLRKQQQDEARAKWLADEAAFSGEARRGAE